VDTSRVSLRAFDSAMRLVSSRKWPFVRASVLSADSPQAGRYGCTVVRVYYKYPVNREKYGDTLESPSSHPNPVKIAQNSQERGWTLRSA
jgi:hypothetical protein